MVTQALFGIQSSWVGVTKAPFINFSMKELFDFDKILVCLFEEPLYLMDATPTDHNIYSINNQCLDTS